MKLQLVPARAGISWVKLGVRTFFRQPLALSGLFFMFLAVMSLAGSIPVIGLSLALALLPACTLGLMAASKEAGAGKFPMPVVFLSAFRAGRQQLRAMLVLGLWYGVGFWVIMGATALFDNGNFATGYIAGKMPTIEMAQDPATQSAMLAFLLMQMPLSLAFWHAPALVHWHQVPPVKSLFFSLVACLRNFWAFTVFGLIWMALLVGMILVVSLATGLGTTENSGGLVLLPALGLLIAAMFFTSTYFSFRDCFETTMEETP
jgi:hypothetical protein